MMKSDMFSSLSVTQMRQLRSRLLSELAQELESLEPVKAIAIDTWSKEAVKHGASQDHDGLRSKLNKFFKGEVESAESWASELRKCIARTNELTATKLLLNPKKIVKIGESTLQTRESISAVLDGFPEIKLLICFIATYAKDRQLPILSDLQLDVEGTTRCETFVVVHVEVGPLLTYCEENNDVNLAVRALAFYLERSSKRWRTLADVGYEAVKISAQAEALQITHRDDAGHEMCQMNWALRFDPAQSTFVEEYSVKFTPEGLAVGQECSLPADLLEKGHYEEWAAAYCFSNLVKMAKLNESL